MEPDYPKLLRIIKAQYSLKNSDLAEALDVTEQVVKNYLRSTTKLPKWAFEKLSEKYPIKELPYDIHGKVAETKSKFGKSLISYYDVDAIASPMEVFNDQTVKPTSLINIPGFADCDFAVNVYGHSMYPTIESGMIILCKKVSDKTIILPGEIYFIITPDYRMVKRLKKSDRVGYLMACSDNQNGKNSPDGQTYEPVEIPVAQILHLYIVRGSVRRHLI